LDYYVKKILLEKEDQRSNPKSLNFKLSSTPEAERKNVSLPLQKKDIPSI
jgi:hypothetical protein